MHLKLVPFRRGSKWCSVGLMSCAFASPGYELPTAYLSCLSPHHGGILWAVTRRTSMQHGGWWPVVFWEGTQRLQLPQLLLSCRPGVFFFFSTLRKREGVPHMRTPLGLWYQFPVLIDLLTSSVLCPQTFLLLALSHRFSFAGS